MAWAGIGDWLKARDGLLSSPVAIVAAVAAALVALTNFTTGLLKDLGLPGAAPAWLAFALLLLAVFLAYQSYRRYVTSSRVVRPALFTLKPDKPEELVGRERDLADLAVMVQQNRMVFLDGESGNGKSALVSAGLMHTPLEGLHPVLIRDWGKHFDGGPAGNFLLALYRSLGESAGKELDWRRAPDLTLGADALCREFEERCTQVNEKLGRKLLLIADQFDDYQVHHREAFLADRNWIDSGTLARRSAFWRRVRAALVEGKIHLLVVTRDNAVAGLSCLRFKKVDEPISRTILRVGATDVRPLLQSLAQQGDTEVVSRPASGWEELIERLVSDLSGNGSVLMQQAKMALAGLAYLPVLSVKSYERHGGLAGVEALVVTRAIQRAAERIGGGGDSVRVARSVLGGFVKVEQRTGVVKSEQQSVPQIAQVAGGEAAASKLLQSFARMDELIRPVGDVAETYQLDHDYLAGAIVEEATRAGSWMHALENGERAFRQAGGLREKWKALLSFPQLIGLVGMRWKTGFSLSKYRRYLGTSIAMQVAYAAFCAGLVAGVVGWWRDSALDMQARDLLARFGTSREPQTAYALWSGPAALRDRTLRWVREDSALAERVLPSSWPAAYSGVDPDAANAVLDIATGESTRVVPSFSGDHSSCPASAVSPRSLRARIAAYAREIEQARVGFPFVALYVDCLTSDQPGPETIARRVAQIGEWRQRGLPIDTDLRLRLGRYLGFAANGDEPTKLLAMAQARQLIAGNNVDVIQMLHSAIEAYGTIAAGITDRAALVKEYDALFALEPTTAKRLWPQIVYLLSELAPALPDEDRKVAVMDAMARTLGTQTGEIYPRFWRNYVVLMSSLSEEKRNTQAEALRSYALQEAYVRNFWPMCLYFEVSSSPLLSATAFAAGQERAVVDGLGFIRSTVDLPPRFWEGYRRVLEHHASEPMVDDVLPRVFDRLKALRTSVVPVSFEALAPELRAVYVSLMKKLRDPARKAAQMQRLVAEFTSVQNELLLESYVELIADAELRAAASGSMATLTGALKQPRAGNGPDLSTLLALLATQLQAGNAREAATLAEPLFAQPNLWREGWHGATVKRICESTSASFKDPIFALPLLRKLRENFVRTRSADDGTLVATPAVDCYKTIAGSLPAGPWMDGELAELRHNLFAVEKYGYAARYQAIVIPYVTFVASKFAQSGTVVAEDAVNLAILLGDPSGNAGGNRLVLRTLSAIAGKDFGGSTYEAAAWVRQKYPGEAGELRPPPLH